MDVASWSVDQVAAHFREALVIADDIIGHLEDNDVNGLALLECTEAELKDELGIKLGPR